MAISNNQSHVCYSLLHYFAGKPGSIELITTEGYTILRGYVLENNIRSQFELQNRDGKYYWSVSSPQVAVQDFEFLCFTYIVFKILSKRNHLNIGIIMSRFLQNTGFNDSQINFKSIGAFHYPVVGLIYAIFLDEVPSKHGYWVSLPFQWEFLYFTSQEGAERGLKAEREKLPKLHECMWTLRKGYHKKVRFNDKFGDWLSYFENEGKVKIFGASFNKDITNSLIPFIYNSFTS